MRKRGRVKSYSQEAGFGFIESAQGEEFFVHRTALRDAGWLESGREVEFESREPGRATQVVQLPIVKLRAAGM
jgi:CspA family cold shock protein